MYEVHLCWMGIFLKQFAYCTSLLGCGERSRKGCSDVRTVMELERATTVCSLGRTGVSTAEATLLIHWRSMKTNIFFS